MPLAILILLVIAVGTAFFITRIHPLINKPDTEHQADNETSTKTTPTITTKQPKTNTIHNPAPTKIQLLPTSTTNLTQTNNQNTNTIQPTQTPTQTPTSTSSQTTGTLKGTVKDQNGNSLPNATFQISCSCFNLRNEGTQDEQADSSGNFTINNLPTVTLTIKPFYGVWGNPQTANMVAGQTITINLVVNIQSTPTPTPQVARTVQVTYPNGGETVTVGQTIRITWDKTGDFDQFQIGISEGPGSLSNIATVTNPNINYYDWVVGVGNTTKTQFKIDVLGWKFGSSGGSYEDQSDNFFTVNK